MHPGLADRWNRHCDSIERALLASLPECGDCPPRLREAMEYSLMAGGKRLRPVLTLFACEACGGTAAEAIPAACALEMVHTYSLIHDDLPAMDDDDLRRGRPTNHKQFGEALAILAGDALLTRAFEIVAAGVRPADVAAACCADLAAAAGAAGMVGGQVADLEAEDLAPSGDQDVDGRHLVAIHRRKTGALIACAASLGGRVAGINEETRLSLAAFGRNVGLAFQIADDLLDRTGDRDRMGKGVGKDAALGKLTYPGLYGVEESRRKAAALVDAACSAVEPLGPAGEPLTALARFVLERDH
ncbi:MAG: polyprenyl synthetase family protein [Planctomycetaceae bacterium]|nr:polyprenyl synthetase family protein [Planctomycetaceae bacterium]